MSHSIKSIRNKFKENGVFYSDPRMAEKMKSLLPAGVDEVYDPTCGDGALLAVFPDEVRKYGQELDPQQAQVARERLANAEIAEGDVLTAPAFLNRQFKYILANPPFGTKWNIDAASSSPIFEMAPCLPPPGKGDYAFILHILHVLSDDGTAVVLNFPGVLYRGQREGRLRQWIIERNVIDRIEHMEGGYFEDTKVATAIIVFKKQRSKDTITFADHETGLEREVTLDEIRENGYTLNVQNYVHSEEPDKWANFDPIEAERLARGKVLQQLKVQMEFSKSAIELHKMMGWPELPPMSEFVKEIYQITNQYL